MTYRKTIYIFNILNIQYNNTFTSKTFFLKGYIIMSKIPVYYFKEHCARTDREIKSISMATLEKISENPQWLPLMETAKLIDESELDERDHYLESTK